MKFAKLLTAALLILALCTGCLAEETSGLALEGIEINSLPTAGNLEATVPEASYALGATTLDSVSVNGNSKTVYTPGGIAFSYSSNSYLSISQDVIADYYVYANCFNDINEVQNWMISNECHLLLLGRSFEVYLYDDGVSPLGSLVGNANDLTDADAKQIIGLYKQQYTNYSIDCGYLGGNVWFALNGSNGDFLITFVNGHEIVAVLNCTDINEAYSAMDGLTVTGM